jgi:hypothetical protein
MMGGKVAIRAAILPFNLKGRIPAFHLLRRINPVVTRILAGLREKPATFYSDIGRAID